MFAAQIAAANAIGQRLGHRRLDPLRLGFRSGLDPEAQHSLQRAEPIRWFREGEARTRRAVESNDDEMETEA